MSDPNESFPLAVEAARQRRLKQQASLVPGEGEPLPTADELLAEMAAEGELDANWPDDPFDE